MTQRESARPTDASVVDDAVKLIDARLESGEPTPRLSRLADELGTEPARLRRAFESLLGVTPHAYTHARKAQRLRESLSAGNPTADAIAAAGFGSPSRVYEKPDELLGMSPGQYRRGAPGETVSYALADTTLGRIVVAWTERGVCLVAFGETDEILAEEVHRRFARARIESARGDHASWVQAVVEIVEAGTTAADLPLDVRGTVFQLQVWSALRQIAPGETVTYGRLAAAIGRPSAVRAVAQACGANPVAVVIPCHRVIGADGTLTGYRWGVPLKKVLLEREREDRG
jgi:AraC family transcriptional regulator of adaptative response/methylated-DNA-[protein]-cysteine methyltransferase